MQTWQHGRLASRYLETSSRPHVEHSKCWGSCQDRDTQSAPSGRGRLTSTPSARSSRNRKFVPVLDSPVCLR